MTLNTIKRVMLYSLVALVLISCTFQQHQLDSSFKEENQLIIEHFEETEILSKDEILGINAIPHNYSQIGNWSATDSVYEVVVDDNYAYVAAGKDGVRILDISDKTNVTEVSYFQIGTTAIARGIWQNETYLFVAYGSNGFVILDISAIAVPTKIGEVKDDLLGYECYALTLRGSAAYLACGGFGLAAVDVADPDNPAYAAKSDTSEVDFRDLDSVGDYVYVADANYGVRRYTITDPLNPQWNNGYWNKEGLSEGVYGIDIRDDYRAFVADKSGFYILSLYSFPDFSILDWYTDGNVAFDVFILNNTAFVSYENDIGLRLFNITDVQNIEFSGRFNDGGDGKGIIARDGFAYLSDGVDGLEVISLDNDSDLLYDGYEINDVFTNPFIADTDGDTLLDGIEFYGLHSPNNKYATNDYFYGLDPLNNDTDGDTIYDSEEAFLGVDGFYTDPLNDDSDSDDLDDYVEIYTYFTDPTDSDSDDDQLKDGDEINIHGTNPLSNDTDTDGMRDYYEVYYTLDPLSDDTNLDLDGDGLTNYFEYNYSKGLIGGIRPNAYDSDSDGLSDGEEILGYYTPDHPYANATGWITTNSPLSDDTDADQLSDGLEVLGIYNPYHPDANLTGYVFTDFNNSDSDNDQLSDYEEVYGIYKPNNPGANLTGYVYPNPNNNDTDGDLMADWWEITYKTNPLVDDADEDYDLDGLTNYEEYLLGTNPTRSDTDGDGMPDGWEIDNLFDPLEEDGIFDDDSDGLSNVEEYQAGTNPHNTDTDSDGMGDQWEVETGTNATLADANEDYDSDGLTNIEEMAEDTNPLVADTDGDGLLDGEEVKTYFTNPNRPDSDGDGASDFEEINAGTDPNNSKSNPDQRLRMIYVSIGGGIAVGIIILLGVFFTIYWTAQPEQKMFRYLGKQRDSGVESLTVKEISIFLDKKLNRGEVKQTINEFSETKGFTLEGNRVYLTSRSMLDKNIDEYFSWLDKKESSVVTSKDIRSIKERIEHDIKMCKKLGLNDILSELESILTQVK